MGVCSSKEVEIPEKWTAPLSHKGTSQFIPTSIHTIRSSIGSKCRFEDRYYFNDACTMLGKGGEATVYEGIDKVNMNKVAVKIIIKKEIKRKDGLKHIRREVELMMKLHHPNILGVYDFFENDELFLMCLDIARGGSLFDRIVKKKRFAEHEAREILRKLVEAIHYMHSKNVVHRDLKPENILIRDKGTFPELMIADFGYAMETEGDVLTEQLGTPNYVAPEVLLRQPYGKAVDVWATGVILFVMLGGSFPFNHPHQNTLFRIIIKGAYKFSAKWDSVSAEGKDLVSKILVVDAASRITTQDILNHPWMSMELAMDLPGEFTESYSSTFADVDSIGSLEREIPEGEGMSEESIFCDSLDYEVDDSDAESEYDEEGPTFYSIDEYEGDYV